MKVFLVGYMGCGKSSIGRAVAQAAGFSFADTDKEVERECGMSVADIFSAHGEAYFRTKEREVIERLAQADGNLVIATGGGVPCHGDNMEFMNSAGLTVYFRMSPVKLASRLEHGRGKRPLIKDLDDAQLIAFIEESLGKRAWFYQRASLVIDCDGASDEYIARHVVEHINKIRHCEEP